MSASQSSGGAQVGDLGHQGESGRGMSAPGGSPPGPVRRSRAGPLNPSRAAARHLPAGLPAALPRTPLAWLQVFGPGAIIASVTIGTGELIFSSRAGSIFGYRVLWMFLLICVLKWALVFATARHMVLTGAHPIERWMSLPGPRGWFPLIFAISAVVLYPVFVGFHSGVIGTLGSWLLGGDNHFWGALVLFSAWLLAILGGYSVLEGVQRAIIAAMVVCVAVSGLLLKPDLWEVMRGLLVPGSLHYPAWLADAYPKIAGRPVWVETSVCVAVLGGASYDYLAYVSFMRNKAWGLSSERAVVEESRLQAIAGDARHPVRQWVRAPLFDCILSFVAVMFFAGVFVVAGTVVLGPQHKIPDEINLLNLQSEFFRRIHPWLVPLYVVGAFLALFGTLYGQFEMLLATLNEVLRAFSREFALRWAKQLRRWTVLWCGLGGYAVLAWSYTYHLRGASANPPSLVDILTPPSLFSGVLSCGFICLLSLWMDRRFLPGRLRMGRALLALNLVGGLAFVGIGLKAYYDWGMQKSGTATAAAWIAAAILLATLACGWTAAWIYQTWQARRH